MTSLGRFAVACLALAACGSSTETSVIVAPRAASPLPLVDAAAPAIDDPTPRWIAKTWFAAAIIDDAPVIALCADGRYKTTMAFHAGPRASGVSVNTDGLACCVDDEHGTYELVRDSSGAIIAITFTPQHGPKRTSRITTTDELENFSAAPRAQPCD